MQEVDAGFGFISDKLMKTEIKVTEEMLNQALSKLESSEQNMIADIIGNNYELVSLFIYHAIKGTIKLSESSELSRGSEDSTTADAESPTDSTSGGEDNKGDEEEENLSPAERNFRFTEKDSQEKFDKIIEKSETLRQLGDLVNSFEWQDNTERLRALQAAKALVSNYMSDQIKNASSWVMIKDLERRLSFQNVLRRARKSDKDDPAKEDDNFKIQDIEANLWAELEDDVDDSQKRKKRI